MQLFKSGLALFLLVGFTFHLASADEMKSDNPFTQNYKVRSAVQPAASTEAPRVFRGTNREADYYRLLEEGYDQLGSSSFQTGDVDPEKLTEHAIQVHADLTLVYTTSVGKVPANVKLEAAKAKAKMQVKEVAEKALGEGQLMDIEQPLYDYYATFWMKLPPPVLGIHVQDRNQDDDQPGVPVVAVIKGPPAAGADIRRGDVILKIAEVEVNKGDVYVQTVRSNVGKTIEILLLREDILVQKTVTLSPK